MNAHAEDLMAARDLARAGVRLFLAQPDPAERTGYRLPTRWESGAVADPDLVDKWQPGMALCAVMGGPLDLVDLDPRNADGAVLLPDLPPALAEAATPSGGRHLFVSSLGLPSLDGVAPGLDYKGGDPLGNGCGFAFIAPTVRLSKADGLPHPYRWVTQPRSGAIVTASNHARANGLNGVSEGLRRAIAARRELRVEGRPRRVPESVALREWQQALQRLGQDLLHWNANGWGGAAHAGLLAHTTHLARLSPQQAEEGFRACFAWARIQPDEDDLAKLESALRSAVPDVVVPDTEMDQQELFWAGAEVPSDRPRPGPPAVDPAIAGGPFDFCDPAELDAPRPVPSAAYGAFGGQTALFYADGVHWLQGESESGKTWVMLALVLEVLRAGGSVLLLDYEDTRAEVLARLRCLGAAGSEVTRLVYLGGHDVAHADLTAHLRATDRDYALLAVDGVTSALTAAGLSGRDEQELTAWADAVPRRARAAVCVDHMVKDPEGRNGMAIGTQAKKSVVTGTAFEVRCTAKFGHGTTGALELRLQKDKRGGVRGRARAVIRLRFASDPATGAVTIQAAGPGDATSTDAFLGQTLVAEAERRAVELCAALQADGANADLTANALIRRLRTDLNQGAKKTTMLRAVHLFKKAAGKPVDVEHQPIGEDDET